MSEACAFAAEDSHPAVADAADAGAAAAEEERALHVAIAASEAARREAEDAAAREAAELEAALAASLAAEGGSAAEDDELAQALAASASLAATAPPEEEDEEMKAVLAASLAAAEEERRVDENIERLMGTGSLPPWWWWWWRRRRCGRHRVVLQEVTRCGPRLIRRWRRWRRVRRRILGVDGRERLPALHGDARCDGPQLSALSVRLPGPLFLLETSTDRAPCRDGVFATALTGLPLLLRPAEGGRPGLPRLQRGLRRTEVQA